jgi:hypothetical protein
VLGRFFSVPGLLIHPLAKPLFSHSVYRLHLLCLFFGRSPPIERVLTDTFP